MYFLSIMVPGYILLYICECNLSQNWFSFTSGAEMVSGQVSFVEGSKVIMKGDFIQYCKPTVQGIQARLALFLYFCTYMYMVTESICSCMGVYNSSKQ